MTDSSESITKDDILFLLSRLMYDTATPLFSTNYKGQIIKAEITVKISTSEITLTLTKHV